MKILVFVFAAVCSGGCTFLDSGLTLEYTPAMSSIARAPQPVFLVRVLDRRPDTKRIGIKKSGFGSEDANLSLDVSLTDWFGGVLNQEFKRAGLTLAARDNPRVVQVDIELLDFFIEPKKPFLGSYEIFAQIHAEVAVRFPDGTGYARRFAKLSSDTSVLPTDGSYEDVMLQTMGSWIQEAVTEIVRLIESRVTSSAASGRSLAAWRQGP